MSRGTHEDAPEQVLSTLNKDGTRRWLQPRLATGRFWRRRRVVAYGLIALFVALPWIRIGGKPAILLDLPAREFTFFGTTLLPTDTLLLMLFMASVFVTIFLLTALFGRVWCGWACPQTVYLEFVFRPIERLFGGHPGRRTGRGGRSRSMGSRAAQYGVYLAVSLLLAHVFVSYFVGVERLFDWMRQSPLEHPTAFLVMGAVTTAMMFDFSFFREQTCLVACPYGRFQSALLDRQSVIVGYDERRGEPRGKAPRRPKAGADVSLPQAEAEAPRGDCIDCTMCVQVCPTGIDIRDGLQMECVHCTQCIDACDAIMDKIGRPRGLIRYSSQEAMERGRARLLRPRVIVYPLLLLTFVGLFVTVWVTRADADITILRAIETPYRTLETGDIQNVLRVKIVNRGEAAHAYALSLEGLDGARLSAPTEPVSVAPGETVTVTAAAIVPRDAFHLGRAEARVRIEDGEGFATSRRLRLQGPLGSAPAPAPAPEEDSTP